MFCLSKTTVLFCCVLVVSAMNVAGQQCNGSANCVTLESCAGLYTQLSQGVTDSLKQLLKTLHCGFSDKGQTKVCCPPEYASTYSSTFDPISLLPTTRTCGIQNNDRITGGVRTDIDEHPWMALLRFSRPPVSGFNCGGVLISERYVMTAAHCVHPNKLTPGTKITQVHLGDWDISSTLDCVKGECSPPPQDIPIEEIIIHERYDTEHRDEDDIALLRLVRNAQLNDFVKPICLPLSNELRQSSFSGEDMEVAGWGQDKNRHVSKVKLKARVPIMSPSQCANLFQTANRTVSNKQVCAGGVGGRDACRGDSGGPLMGHAPQGNNWIAVGIVSKGSNPCGFEGWPGVYTRVGAYIDWILSKLKP